MNAKIERPRLVANYSDQSSLYFVTALGCYSWQRPIIDWRCRYAGRKNITINAGNDVDALRAVRAILKEEHGDRMFDGVLKTR